MVMKNFLMMLMQRFITLDFIYKTGCLDQKAVLTLYFMKHSR